MSTTFCSHGDLQRDKLGVTTDEHDVTTCKGCGLPVWDQHIGKKLAAIKDGSDGSGVAFVPKANTAPDPSWHSRDNDLHAIRMMLGIFMAVIGLAGLLFFTGVLQVHQKVCVLYADGTSRCR